MRYIKKYIARIVEVGTRLSDVMSRFFSCEKMLFSATILMRMFRHLDYHGNCGMIGRWMTEIKTRKEHTCDILRSHVGYYQYNSTNNHMMNIAPGYSTRT